MATETEQLVVALEARTRDFERNLQRATRTAYSNFSRIERRAQQSSKRMEASLKGSVANINGILGTLGVGIGFNELRKLADTWTDLTSRVNIAAGSQEQGAAVMERLSQIARRTYSDLNTTTESFVANSQALKDLGYSTQTQLDYTEALNNALVVSGAKGKQAESVQNALAKAMALGTLQGQNLNTVISTGGRVAQALADGLGVTVSELRALGTQGKLTSDVLVNALTGQLDKLREEADSMEATFGDALVLLQNSLTEYVGKLNQAGGATSFFASGIISAADNIEHIGTAAAAAAAVILSQYVPGLARAALAQTAMVATNPFLLLATAIAGASFALSAFGGEIQPVEGELANLHDYAGAAFDGIRASASDAATYVRDAFLDLANFISDALGGAEVSLEDLANFAKTTANVLINSFVLVKDVIVTSFTELPQAIAEAVLNAFNGLIASVESAINAVVGAVNTAVSAINTLGSAVGVELGKIGEISLGRLENSFAGSGEAAGKAYADAFNKVTRDRVGEALGAMRIRANERAAERERLKAEEANKPSPIDNVDNPKAPASAAKAEKQSAFDRELQSLRERTSLLLVEAEARRNATGSYEEQEAAVERARIVHELLNAAQREGIEITDEVRANIEKLADAYVAASQEAKALAKQQREAAKESKELAKQQREVHDQLRDIESTGSDAMKGLIKDLAAGKSPAEALANAIQKIADKLLDMALNAMFDGLFEGIFTGKSNSGGNSLGGGLGPVLSNLFSGGGGQQRSSVQSIAQNTMPASRLGGDALQAASSLPGSGSIDFTPIQNAVGNKAQQALNLAATQIGKHEVANNADIGAFLKQGGVDINAAQTAWCAGFVNSSLEQVGIKGSNSLVANSFRKWGNAVDPRHVLPGDVLVKHNNKGFGTGGHVGFATGETRMGKNGLELQMLSGNAQNRVQTDWHQASQLEARRATEQAQTQAMQQQMEAQRQLQTQLQQTSQATQAAVPPMQGFQTGLSGVQSGMQNFEGGIASMVGQLGQGVPVVGQFGGAIQQMLSQMVAPGRGGGGLLGGLLGFAEGGHVRGPGTSTSDSIPAMLSDGEFVVNAKATKKNRAALEAINSGKVPAFAKGGIVAGSNFASSSTYAPVINVSANGLPGGNSMAGQIASKVSQTLDHAKPDTFRKTETQKMTEAQHALHRAVSRNG